MTILDKATFIIPLLQNLIKCNAQHAFKPQQLRPPSKTLATHLARLLPTNYMVFIFIIVGTTIFLQTANPLQMDFFTQVQTIQHLIEYKMSITLLL